MPKKIKDSKKHQSDIQQSKNHSTIKEHQANIQMARVIKTNHTKIKETKNESKIHEPTKLMQIQKDSKLSIHMFITTEIILCTTNMYINNLMRLWLYIVKIQ